MSLKKFEIGKRFAVFPFYEGGEIAPGGRIPILIGYGKAFGSGEHETTASCLEELEEIAGRGDFGSDVLDLGSGTGILAIAAAKLGARSVTAVEPEPEAVDATIQNVRLNGVEAVVQTLAGDVATVSGRRFDLVLANIYGDVLVPIAPDIARLLVPAGHVILSGIHYDFAYDVKTAYAKEGLELLRSRALENYCTFVFLRV